MNEMAAMPKKFIFKNSKEREREREREREGKYSGYIKIIFPRGQHILALIS